jgi:transcription initiation factor TFIIH subunit 2
VTVNRQRATPQAPKTMADSDPEYDDRDVDDDDDIPITGGRRRQMASRPKGRTQARWEAKASRNWELQEAADGGLEGVLGGIEEAWKRKRYA